jgi:hypothetical protein
MLSLGPAGFLDREEGMARHRPVRIAAPRRFEIAVLGHFARCDLCLMQGLFSQTKHSKIRPSVAPGSAGTMTRVNSFTGSNSRRWI